MVRTATSLAALVLSLFASGAHAAPVAITTCGQTVAEGVLVGDLDCGAASGFAVVLTDGGWLDLAGYRLTGTADHSLDPQNPIYGGGVHCLGECTVTGGGGAIVAPPGVPAESLYSIGIYSDPYETRSRMRLDNMTISGWSTYGVLTRFADVSNCHFTGNAYGIVVENKMTMDGCTLTGNSARGAHFSRGEVSNSSFDGNHEGFYVMKGLRLFSSSASNNQSRGLFIGGRVRAEDSVIDGNCLSPPGYCADVVARRRPQLINTSCTTSYNDVANSYWYVCSQN